MIFSLGHLEDFMLDWLFISPINLNCKNFSEGRKKLKYFQKTFAMSRQG